MRAAGTREAREELQPRSALRRCRINGAHYADVRDAYEHTDFYHGSARQYRFF